MCLCMCVRAINSLTAGPIENVTLLLGPIRFAQRSHYLSTISNDIIWLSSIKLIFFVNWWRHLRNFHIDLYISKFSFVHCSCRIIHTNLCMSIPVCMKPALRGGVCNPSFWDGGIWGCLEDSGMVDKHSVSCQRLLFTSPELVSIWYH